MQVFEGGELQIRDKYSFDCPAIKSLQDWEQLFYTLFTNAERFAQHIEQMSEEQLDSIFVKEEYGTYRRNIEGMIEHSYYHLGQVRLIKKLLEEQA